jgi:hypothetical protein
MRIADRIKAGVAENMKMRIAGVFGQAFGHWHGFVGSGELARLTALGANASPIFNRA